MKKNAKVAIILLAVVGAVLLAVYVLVAAVYTEPEQTLNYPAGNLADNYMDASLFEYTKNEALDGTYEFMNIPYTVDVPDVSEAPVGNGAVYQIQKDYVLYLTEYTDPATPQAVVQKEFPQIVLMNALPAATEIVAMQDSVGKINGFNAEYIADHLVVSDGAKKQEAALFGYQLNGENKYAGRHMFIAVGTTVMKQEAFDKLYSYLNIVIKTLQWSESRDNELTEAMQAQDLASTDSAATDSDEGRSEVSGDTDSSSGTSSGSGSSTVGVLSSVVQVDQDYSKLMINVSWPNPVDSVVLELFSPDGSMFWSPVSKDSTSATFVLENVTAGDYKLNVKGSDTGEISVGATGE